MKNIRFIVICLLAVWFFTCWSFQLVLEPKGTTYNNKAHYRLELTYGQEFNDLHVLLLEYYEGQDSFVCVLGHWFLPIEE